MPVDSYLPYFLKKRMPIRYPYIPITKQVLFYSEKIYFTYVSYSLKNNLLLYKDFKLTDMFLKLIFLSVLLVAVSMLIMGIKIFLRKNGRFPEIDIERNPDMHKIGIICPKEEERKLFKNYINDASDCITCTSFSNEVG